MNRVVRKLFEDDDVRDWLVARDPRENRSISASHLDNALMYQCFSSLSQTQYEENDFHNVSDNLFVANRVCRSIVLGTISGTKLPSVFRRNAEPVSPISRRFAVDLDDPLNFVQFAWFADGSFMIATTRFCALGPMRADVIWLDHAPDGDNSRATKVLMRNVVEALPAQRTSIGSQGSHLIKSADVSKGFLPKLSHNMDGWRSLVERFRQIPRGGGSINVRNYGEGGKTLTSQFHVVRGYDFNVAKSEVSYIAMDMLETLGLSAQVIGMERNLSRIYGSSAQSDAAPVSLAAKEAGRQDEAVSVADDMDDFDYGTRFAQNDIVVFSLADNADNPKTLSGFKATLTRIDSADGSRGVQSSELRNSPSGEFAHTSLDADDVKKEPASRSVAGLENLPILGSAVRPASAERDQAVERYSVARSNAVIERRSPVSRCEDRNTEENLGSRFKNATDALPVSSGKRRAANLASSRAALSFGGTFSDVLLPNQQEHRSQRTAEIDPASRSPLHADIASRDRAEHESRFAQRCKPALPSINDSEQALPRQSFPAELRTAERYGPCAGTIPSLGSLRGLDVPLARASHGQNARRLNGGLSMNCEAEDLEMNSRSRAQSAREAFEDYDRSYRAESIIPPSERIELLQIPRPSQSDFGERRAGLCVPPRQHSNSFALQSSEQGNVVFERASQLASNTSLQHQVWRRDSAHFKRGCGEKETDSPSEFASNGRSRSLGMFSESNGMGRALGEEPRSHAEDLHGAHKEWRPTLFDQGRPAADINARKRVMSQEEDLIRAKRSKAGGASGSPEVPHDSAVGGGFANERIAAYENEAGLDEAEDCADENGDLAPKRSSFACSVCALEFNAKSNLTRHVRMVHEKRKPYKCSVCSEAFVQTSGLKRHFYRFHKDDADQLVEELKASSGAAGAKQKF